MQIDIKKNVFSSEVLDKIISHNDEVYKTLDLKSNHTFWNKKIIEYSKDVYVYQLDKNSVEYTIIENEIKKLNLKNNVIGILYYYWTPGSYIPWHNDGKSYTNAMTIYLNKEWEYNWGGLFQYYNEKEIKTIIPQQNIGILQHGSVQHSTTITKSDSPIRKTIQLFLKSNNIF